MFAVPPLPADLSSQPNHGTARNKKAIQLRRPLCNFSSQQLLPNELVLGGCQKHLELVENGSSNNKTRNANRKRQDAGEDQQRQQQHQRQHSQKRHRQGRHHHCQQNAHTCRTYNMMKATATTAKATHTHITTAPGAPPEPAVVSAAVTRRHTPTLLLHGTKEHAKNRRLQDLRVLEP